MSFGPYGLIIYLDIGLSIALGYRLDCKGHREEEVFMNITFRGIGYTPNDEDRAFLDKKLQKTGFAENKIKKIDIAVKTEANENG